MVSFVYKGWHTVQYNYDSFDILEVSYMRCLEFYPTVTLVVNRIS